MKKLLLGGLLGVWVFGLVVGQAPIAAAATAVGPNSGSVFSDVTGSGLTVAWSSPNNAQSSDDSYATATLGTSDKSHNLEIKNFGFNIPAASVINGISISIEKSASTTNSVVDNNINLIKNNSITGSDKSSSSSWSTTDATSTYGSASDLWNTTWTPADINSSTTGIAISAGRRSGSTGTTIARIDAVTMTVSYTLLSDLPDLTVTQSTSLLTQATVGSPFAYTFTVTNSNAPASFSSNSAIFSDDLPSGVTYGTVSHVESAGVTGNTSCSVSGTGNKTLDCRASGGSVVFSAGATMTVTLPATPTAAGTITNPKPGNGNTCSVDPSSFGNGSVTESNEANNNCSPNPLTVSAAAPSITILPSTLPNATVGSNYSQTLTASTTASGTITWSAQNLPSWLTFATSTQILSGTPTTTGSFPFSVTASAGVSSSTQNYTLTVSPVAPTTGTLHVSLSVDNSLGGSAQPSDFQVTVTGAGATPGTFAGSANQNVTVTGGATFSVSASSQANYVQNFSGNCNGSVVSGASDSCAITEKFTTVIPPVPGNLILNPDFTTATVSTTPDHWTHGSFDDVVSFEYPVTGPTGSDTAARADVITHTDGDAKWVFDSVAAEPGALYTYSDYYNSNVVTSLVVAYTVSGNPNTVFQWLEDLPATNGTWNTTNQQFTAIPGATSMTVYHLVGQVGNISIAHAALVKTASASQTQFPQGIVSLTFDDGWASQYDNALPALRAANMQGSFYIIGTATNNASYDLFKDPSQNITTNTSATTTTWANLFPDPTNTIYRFTDLYRSATTSTVSVTYTLASGTVQTTLLGTLAASVGTNKAVLTFTLPAHKAGTALTFTHTSAVSLVVSSPSLYEYPQGGYLSADQILEMQATGQEIGGHTQNHCNLSQIYTDPTKASSTDICAFPSPSRTVTQEVTDVRTTLSADGIIPLDTFAYPNGSYNADIEGIVGANGFGAARTVAPGYNTLLTDKYALLVQVVDASTTISTIQDWITNAVSNKLWLILVFHQIDNPAKIVSNGETGGVTPQLFQQIVNYLHNNSVVVKTLHDGLNIMNGVTATTPAAPTASPAAGNFSVPQTVSLAATGSQAIHYTIDGSTPNCLTGGQVYYGPLQLTSTTTIKAVNCYAGVASAVTTFSYSIVAPSISPASIPTIALNTPFTQTFTATDAIASDTFTYSITGTLPVGLTFASSTATISGTPTAVATSTITISAISKTNSQFVASQTYTVVVADVSPLQLSSQQTGTVSTDSITITWTTTHPATSRVLYDTISHSTASSTAAGTPNYGYATSTVEDSALVTQHSVTISGLAASTTYYFRPVSHGSPETLGDEMSITTAAPASSGGGGGSSGGGGGGGGGGGSAVNPAFISGTQGQVLGATTGVHPNGTLVIDGQTVFLIKNAQRVGFRDPQEYASYGYTFAQVVPASAGDKALPASTTVLKAMAGSLVLDSSDHRTVYMIGDDYTKRGFASAAIFKALGYNFNQVFTVNLSDYPTGPVISSATAAHPDGALVLDGQTVWWINGSSRQGFESLAVFNSYGFSFTRVVPANNADRSLPQGSLVKFRDGTLLVWGQNYVIISDGQALPFASTTSLTNLGYNPNNAVQSAWSTYTLGTTIQ